MATPTSESYLKARLDIIKKHEIGDKVDTAFYLDGSGYPTIGYGTLVSQNGKAAAFAQTVIDNSSDPAFARKLVDALSGVTGGTATATKTLEGKGFVFEGTRMVGFKDGKDANGVDIVKDIRNVLPEANALKVFDVVAAKKEAIVDVLESNLKVTFTESQRLEVLSRVYNGLPDKDVREGLVTNGVEGAIAFFSSNRGSQSNPGQYARTIEEVQGYLGDKVAPAEVGNATGFTYKNGDGQDVFIGSQRTFDDKGKAVGAEVVAYKITQNADGTQNQVPLPLPGLESRMRLASTLPLDPGVVLNNAIESGDLREIFKAQALNPDNKTPAELLASFKDLNPEIGEKRIFNIGTDKKPRNVEGYEVVDEDGKTTIYATGKDPKTGKVGVVTLEKDAPTEANPEPKLQGVDLLPKQATQYRLKVSDAGDLEGPQYASAEAADALADLGGHPVVLADAGGSTSDAGTALEEAMTRAILERVDRADAWGKALQEEFGEPVNVVANADGTRSIVNEEGEVLGTVRVERDAVTITKTDGGQIGVSEEGQTSVQFALEAISTPLSSSGLNAADIPVPDLISHFTGDQDAGAYGAGQLGGFDVLPFNESSSFLVNADGDIVAEINHLPNGYYQLKDLGGSAVYISANDGSVLTQDTYEQAQAQALDAAQAAQASQAASALGLMNSIIGLQHWDNMSDLQRTAALVSIYNVVDKFTGDKALPGDLGTAASALGLLNALDKGDIGSIAYSGLSLVENLTSTAGVANSGWVSLNMPGGANFLPGLSFALALSSGDPVSIASSGMALMSSLGMIGPWGMAAAAVISVFGSMFGDDEPDIPTREGLAHAQWDAAGNTLVITDQDIEGGGPTATGWMTSLVDGLQGQLAGMRDASGNAYALVPDLLPAVGFQYNPDGYNLGNGGKGFVYLKWTDEDGQIQTRYYDGAGNRGDGTGETLAGDFMQRAAGAIAPAWQVETVLAHYQQGQGIHLPNAEASLPQELADGLHQTLQALTLALPVEPALQNALIDIDGDGYLERTQWLATNQQVLGVDANGDGLIGTDELLSLNGPAALNSLNWLDANGDHILNASDPAFTALRLWMDVNADADSSGETRTLAQAGIVAIDFGSDAANNEWRLAA